jgi:hypothetical protein
MITERDQQLLADLAERLRAPHSDACDWVDAHQDGDMITTDAAGFIARVSSETIRRRAVEAAERRQPIGVQHATVWLISRSRLLDWIERNEGLSARLVAETRSRAYR